MAEIPLTYDQSKEICEWIIENFMEKNPSEWDWAAFIISLTRWTGRFSKGTFAPFDPTYIFETYENLDNPYLIKQYISYTEDERIKVFLKMKIT